MMAKTPSQFVPRLRFPEFRDLPEWDLQTLSSASDVNPKNEGLPERFIYVDLESVKNSVLTERKELSRDAAPSRAQRLLSRKDIIYQTVRPYQRNNLFFDIDDGCEYVASTGYAQLRAHESSEFLYQLLHTNPFVNRVLARCTGSNYPAINPSTLASINVLLPKEKEQEKIADCLGSLDDLIAAEDRKLEVLRQHKQGLMQQLFPQPGETVPRLRFAEFRDDPPWSTRALGDFATFMSGGTPSKNVPEYWNGHIPWISAASMYDTNIHDSERKVTSFAIGNGTRIAKAGSLLILTRGSMLYNRVPMGIASIDVAFNQDVRALKIDTTFNKHFLLNLLMAQESLIPINDTGIGAGKIDSEDLRRVPVVFPKFAEQQQITDCFGYLDNLIAGQGKKVEALRQHKHGLMQQLFPSLEGR